MNTLGTERPDTATFALLYTNYAQMVEKGIALIDHCPEIYSKTATLVACKELVNRLLVLETYAFLLSRKNTTDLDYLHSKMRTQFGEFKS